MTFNLFDNLLTCSIICILYICIIHKHKFIWVTYSFTWAKHISINLSEEFFETGSIIIKYVKLHYIQFSLFYNPYYDKSSQIYYIHHCLLDCHNKYYISTEMNSYEEQSYQKRLKSSWHDLEFYCCVVRLLCLALCDPTDYSLPGSSVHGIFQARILEWVAISFSRKSSQPRNQACISCTACEFFTH